MSEGPNPWKSRAKQVCVLGSAEPGSRAFELAGAAGEMLAKRGVTLVSGCGSPATRNAAEKALAAGGLVVSIVPSDDIGLKDWPCSVLIPSGMGDARNFLMALAGDACIVIGGRAGTISEVCLAWLHHRPLLPLTGCGGWSDQLERNPPDERQNSRILFDRATRAPVRRARPVRFHYALSTLAVDCASKFVSGAY